MIDIEQLVDLASKAHTAEVIEYNRIHINRHVPTDCPKCLNIAAARMRIEEAEEVGSNVVLYIP
jgi:hypothetical protein